MARATVLLAALLLSTPCGGAVIGVNSVVDESGPGDGLCTLREALGNANADADETAGDCVAGDGADEVDLPAGHYLRTRANALQLGDALLLRGAGADVTVIDAAGLDGVLVIHSDGGPVQIEGVTLTGGAMTKASTDAGGIENWGADLTVLDCIVSGNRGNTAGGIVQLYGAIRIVRSLIQGNFGYQAGGIVVQQGYVDLIDSTVSGNEATALCHFICVGAAAIFGRGVSVLFSTIVDNSCDLCPAAVVGAAVLKASLLSNPHARANCAGATSAGYNLADDYSCGVSKPGDHPGEPPGITSLADHGGPTATHALLLGSAAVDAIPAADCGFEDDGDPETPEVRVTEDQRAAPRPAPGDAGRCDIGAFEGSIEGNAPPTVFCDDVAVRTEPGVCVAAASVLASASDPEDDPLVFEQVPAGPYVGGSTEVTLRATDAAGNSDDCRAWVTVRDEEPPVITCNATLPRRYFGPFTNTHDNCGPALAEESPLGCVKIKKNGKRVARRCHPDFIAGDINLRRSPRAGVHVRVAVTALDLAGNLASETCETLVIKR